MSGKWIRSGAEGDGVPTVEAQVRDDRPPVELSADPLDSGVVKLGRHPYAGSQIDVTWLPPDCEGILAIVTPVVGEEVCAASEVHLS